jgi:hypothetical protein
MNADQCHAAATAITHGTYRFGEAIEPVELPGPMAAGFALSSRASGERVRARFRWVAVPSLRCE